MSECKKLIRVSCSSFTIERNHDHEIDFDIMHDDEHDIIIAHWETEPKFQLHSPNQSKIHCVRTQKNVRQTS